MTRYRAGTKPPVHPTGEWLRVSHEMTWETEDMADRDDLVVYISPDAGFDDAAYHDGELITDEHGKALHEQHPGVTFPKQGIIEINAHYLPDGLKPEDMHPEIRKDHENYPVVWGITSHEAAHAHYSKWIDEIDSRNKKGLLKDEETPWIGAAVILEETRIEKKQVDFRPQDQPWLQASGTHLALEEVSKQIKEAQAQGQGDIPKNAVARSAALVLARVDAGSVIADDTTKSLQTLVDQTFGEDAKTLRRIWRDAQSTADDDWQRMLALGKEWYELTGDSGDDGEQIVVISMGDGGDGDGQSPLEQALREAAKNAAKEASGENERERRRARIKEIVGKRRDEGKASQQAKEQARGVFAGKGNDYSSPISGYRPPTPAELSLARTTRRQLQAAYLPERAVTKVTHTLPPGRLSMRAVQQLEAQDAAGLLPTVEPFTYKDRQHVPTPPLKVGIIQDVSASQSSAAAASASGAWSLAKATQMIADAEVAMVSFGDRVNPIINPRQRLKQVPIIRTPYGTNYFTQALQAIEGELDLTRAGAARLVVILTDGYFMAHDISQRDPAIKRLADMGVKFLWMVTDGDGDAEYTPYGIKGVHVYKDAAGHFDVIPKVINGEAVRALKK
jgi:hypothetical protein